MKKYKYNFCCYDINGKGTLLDCNVESTKKPSISFIKELLDMFDVLDTTEEVEICTTTLDNEYVDIDTISKTDFF